MLDGAVSATIERATGFRKGWAQTIAPTSRERYGGGGIEMGATMDSKNTKKIEIKKTLKKNLALEIKTLEVRAAPTKAARWVRCAAAGRGAG